MTGRRNVPDINLNGATFRGVRVHGSTSKRENGKFGVRSWRSVYVDDCATLSKAYRQVMKLVERYQDEGFSVEYVERFQVPPLMYRSQIATPARKVADITIKPPKK